MKTKFKTFSPYKAFDRIYGNIQVTATTALNRWLEENPKVEIISWQATAVGTTGELYITVQYREPED